MEKINWSGATDVVKNIFWVHGPRILYALVILIVGWIIISWLLRVMGKRLTTKFKDPTLGKFLKTFTGVVLRVILLITVAGMLGIEITSFIALIGTAGLAIGLALQGSLQNFAAGVMILIFRPYRVGDYVEAGGQSGTVMEVQIFNTILLTPDNKTIILPNSSVLSGAVKNYTKEGTRRLDWEFTVAYGSDLEKVRSTIFNLLKDDPRLLKDKDIFIKLAKLADSSINIAVRVWVKSEDYWGLFFEMNEKVYTTFNEEGISIPFPQMDVHMHQKNA